MLDSTLRPVKDRLLRPLIATPLKRVPPLLFSGFGLVCTLGAAGAATQRWSVVAVVLWLVGRVADGLDGAVARATGNDSDLGGLIDFTLDTIGYAAVPIGIAVGLDDRNGVGHGGIWIVTAVLLASFYINAVTLGYVASLIEKRSAGQSTGPTSAVLPRGLVEGTETIVFFTVALAAGASADIVWWVMAAAVIVTAAERVRWATGWLR